MTDQRIQLRIDGRYHNPNDYRIDNPRVLPDSVTYPGGWLRYGIYGIIKPENWRYVTSV